MTRKILLVTVGTLGDLHPFIAIGLALQARGFRPVLAVAADHVPKCLAAGLEAEAVLPGFDIVARAMGLSKAEATRRLMGSQRLMMDWVLMSGLAESVAALDRLAEDADAVVGSLFAFAAAMIAEKRDLPLITLILQPMAMLSTLDPPATPDFGMMRQAPVGLVGAAWNRLTYAALRQLLHALYGGKIDRVRTGYGLSRAGARRLLEPADNSVLRLGCYSSTFAPLPRDVSPRTRLVGFPLFDSASGRDEPLPNLLTAFLAAGPPPVVFTLGSFAVGGGSQFYDRAREAARRLNRRAVLLVGGHAAPRWNESLFTCSYARHSQLFPAAAVIVHHGGIGTTGQAMRAGKPQLVVPHMGDQNDHAARILRHGLGLRLNDARLTASDFEKAIALLISNPSYAIRAAAVAERIANEDGAAAAAQAIVDVMVTC